jgi:hypothetical protein
MKKTAYIQRAALQLVFLTLTVILAVIWCDALRRGTNDLFVPSLILLYVGVVAITALPKVLSGDVPGGAIWTYGSLSLAVVVMGGLLIISNTGHGFPFFPTAAAIDGLKRSFSLVSIYNAIVYSWIFAMLHILTAAAGALSICIAIMEQRDA